MSSSPTVKIESPSPKEGEFTCELLYFSPTEEERINLKKTATSDLFKIIKEKVLNEIPGLLTYANFFGEAEAHMVSKGIPFNKKIREEYAKAIRNELMDNLDKALNLDDDGFISISPFIFALEFGDFYRPATQFISGCIEKWLEEIVSDNT
jgi:hypothetical protein